MCEDVCHNVNSTSEQCEAWWGHIVLLTAARLGGIISDMDNEKTTLRYSLHEGLKGRKDSVSTRRYIAHMKSEGSFKDADLWAAMAEATGRDVEYIQYLEGVRRKAIVAALKSGKRVYAGGMAIAASVKGTFDTVDGEFDPNRNELAVTGFVYGDLQGALGECAAENVVKGGRPILNRVVEIGQEDDEVFVTGANISITGRDLAPSADAADEGVWLEDLKTGERKATAEIAASSLIEVTCVFASLPPTGRYRLVLATRAGNGVEYKLVAATREVSVKDADAV